MDRHTLPIVLSLGALLGLGALVGSPSETVTLAPDDDARPGQAECPGSLGPAMVRTPEGFCIDATEVSRAQYGAWLESAPAAGLGCDDNDSYEPTCAWNPGRDDDQPVVCVDWCDAKAFCEAAGKRLCGAIEGGDAYPVDQYADAEVSEWQAACSSGGQFEYTYGNELMVTPDPEGEICRDADSGIHTSWGFGGVGSFAECHSPDAAYADIMDMSGHVAEWDNSCDDEGCRIRGGSFQHHGVGLRCAAARDLRWPRERTHVSVGIRCCAD